MRRQIWAQRDVLNIGHVILDASGLDDRDEARVLSFIKATKDSRVLASVLHSLVPPCEGNCSGADAPMCYHGAP